MADSVVQTKLDEITLGKIHGDAIRHCIERLNNANQYEDHSVSHANMKGTTASVGKIVEVGLADSIMKVIEKIHELDMMEYQKELLFGIGGELTLKPILNTQKPSSLDGVPVEDSEKHLKKLIKHAKTPMERKAYEKKLNALYKKRKKK